MTFDLHLHTRRYSPDSSIDPFDLVRRACAIGLDGIVITEHDRLWPEEELEELRRRAPGLVILGGVEISGRDGDLLCYGVSDLSALRRGMPWRDLCAEIARQGGVAVAAHPYRWGQDFDRLIIEQSPVLHGMEVMSNNMDAEVRRKAAAFRSRHAGYAALGNSDAHELDKVGCCRTRFPEGVTTMAALIEAIRSGRTEPVDMGG